MSEGYDVAQVVKIALAYKNFSSEVKKVSELLHDMGWEDL